jgi:hypothetical protein
LYCNISTFLLIHLLVFYYVLSQIFYDAITYLSQVSDGILGSQVIADALGINNTTVKRYWNIRGLKNLRTKNSKSTRHYKIIEMEKILKTVREDAKRHTGNANRKPLLESVKFIFNFLKNSKFLLIYVSHFLTDRFFPDSAISWFLIIEQCRNRSHLTQQVDIM